MTNGEIKLVVKALCYALGDSERHYNVKVDDKGIVIEYVISAELVDANPPPWMGNESKYEMGHIDLPLITDLFKLADVVFLAIEDIQAVDIEYKHF